MTELFPVFQDKSLLTTALTHRSALNEKISTAIQSNERLEFLGDAVLELLTTEFLYHRLPQEAEGKLTLIRSALVKTTTLAEIGLQLQMGERLFMSKGEESTGGRKNEGLIANSVEALLGALYLDQGLPAVKVFLEKVLFPKFDQIMAENSYRDHKSYLQEVVQALNHPAPVYEVISEVGPDHDKTFTVQVLVSQNPAGQGTGKSKQQAQQDAAAQALEIYRPQYEAWRFGGTPKITPEK